MMDQYPFHVDIPPVDPGTIRPRWSVMIPTYNCARYLGDTLSSVLSQDPGPNDMQIEVVDDCSTLDIPGEVVLRSGRGRVSFYQQAENVGHCQNFDTCIQRSRGHLIHILHGDDCVREGFYQKMEQAFEQNPEVGAAFCRYISMDEHSQWIEISNLEQEESGIIPNWLEKIASRQRLQTPAMVVRREVYERLGGFDQRIQSYGEDWEMWVRIAASYPVWYEVEPLALYRIRSASLSGTTLRTGKNGQDLRLAIEINRRYLPPMKRKQITTRAKKSFAGACIRRGHRMFEAGDSGGAWAQVREALKTHPSPAIAARGAFVLMRISMKRLRSFRMIRAERK